MTGNNWRDRFEPQRDIGGSAMGAPPSPPHRSPDGEFEDDGVGVDPSAYQPWTLQRGRSRPSMMIDFRRYEPRSGLWSGWAFAYPHLVGIQYTGSRLLSLDFGSAHVVVEGDGLDQLARYIQQGTVLSVQEFAPMIWPTRPQSGLVSIIRQVGKNEGLD